MKGLLIKDFRLMRNMRNSLIMIVIIMAVVSVQVKDVSFVAVYLAFLGVTFAQSTISYDEFENCYSFLLTLPVTRRGYVIEKYGFCLLLSGCGWIIGVIISAAGGAVRGTLSVPDAALEALAVLPVALILAALMIPFRLKYEGEKGRIVMIVTAGVVFGIFLVAGTILRDMDLNLNARWESLPALSMWGVIGGWVAIGVAVFLLSARISISVMEKKEF